MESTLLFLGEILSTTRLIALLYLLRIIRHLTLAMDLRNSIRA